VIFRGPTDVSESVIAQSQQHYEEAQKAMSTGNLELAMSHLEAIEKRTPAWYESRELHWKVKEDLNTYARAKQ
jgi:outer membrane protein assembly factor BamD (BamD/ComL family)